jgi:hypothetical protein
VQGTYTWSKFMEAIAKLNPGDPAPTHVISDLDRQHHLAITGIWELPFGTNRPWLNQRGVLRAVAGGWSFQGVYQAQSGPPLNWGNILFRGNLHDIMLPVHDRTSIQWFNVNAGFERLAGNQLANNVRTFPLRTAGVRANGLNTFDLSLFKNITIWERFTLQLHADAQGALNHPLLAAPDTNPVNGTFGRVSASIWGEQRKVFLGAKLIW